MLNGVESDWHLRHSHDCIVIHPRRNGLLPPGNGHRHASGTKGLHSAWERSGSHRRHCPGHGLVCTSYDCRPHSVCKFCGLVHFSISPSNVSLDLTQGFGIGVSSQELPATLTRRD